MKTSIIMVAYDRLRLSRHITSCALGQIQAYTDRAEYELILIDNDPCESLNRKGNIIELDKHIEINDIGYSASANQAVMLSTQDFPYICFIHNDVFIWEGWLKKLREELEQNKVDIIIPSQNPVTRQQVKDSQKGKIEKLWDDAGLIFMTREAFKKTGGWNEQFKTVYHNLAFGKRWQGLQIRYTNQVIITHIGAATLLNDEKFFRERLNVESALTQQL